MDGTYCTSNTKKVTKSKKTGWERHVACIRERTNEYRL
jgi:hypothetical protein